MQNLSDIRCGHCRRKLAEGAYARLTIKCPRCRVLNHFTTPSHTPAHASERPTPAKDKDVHGNPQTLILS
ncbi:MAG: Com family DNA-binding transcriptional regulator [Pseudomonadota bacterium]|nr:Com family DNA-binding transcriptional regulator [Pseudomonadota bacterium]